MINGTLGPVGSNPILHVQPTLRKKRTRHALPKDQPMPFKVDAVELGRPEAQWWTWREILPLNGLNSSIDDKAEVLAKGVEAKQCHFLASQDSLPTPVRAHFPR